jgi:hypothetical protein
MLMYDDGTERRGLSREMAGVIVDEEGRVRVERRSLSQARDFLEEEPRAHVERRSLQQTRQLARSDVDRDGGVTEEPATGFAGWLDRHAPR